MAIRAPHFGESLDMGLPKDSRVIVCDECGRAIDTIKGTAPAWCLSCYIHLDGSPTLCVSCHEADVHEREAV